MTEAVAPLSSSENIAAFIGWTQVCRALPAIFDKGPITHIGLKSSVQLDWRPMLWRKMALGWNASPKEWLAGYRHPFLIGHDGNGWQWIETIFPQAPWEGLVCPGLYVANAPVATIQMTMGRAEIEGDATGIVTMGENAYQTPAMGLRYRD